jgi:hypothetical protein
MANPLSRMLLNTNGFSNQRDIIPMFGFLCSSKLLYDYSSAVPEFRRERGSPSMWNIATLTEAATPHGMTMLHYHGPPDCVESQITSLLEGLKVYENNTCRAVQMNMRWPSLPQVETLKKRFLQSLACTTTTKKRAR